MMENAQDNNISYHVAVQRNERSKTSNFQELCIHTDRELIIYDWYLSMTYTCDMDPSNKELIFPKFSKILF